MMANRKHGPLSEQLVRLAARGQYGHSRTPARFYMPDPDRDPGQGYCSYYHSGAQWDMSFEEWKRVARLSNRYLRFHHYVTEVAPGWTKVRDIHFADNSIEQEQVDRNGNTRRVMIDGPHGDICF